MFNFRKYLLVSFLFFVCQSIDAQRIKVGLMNEMNTRAIVFSVAEGYYLVNADNEAILTLRRFDNLFVQSSGDSLECYSFSGYIGKYGMLTFHAMTDSSFFGLRVLKPDGPFHYYDDNLILYVDLGKLQTVNEVDFDKYVAGVVEAEGGSRASDEYYKIQAVLCRTYALSHLDRHVDEKFFLCDGTHCQAYKGRSVNDKIASAAFATHNEVVVDRDSVLIVAAFHSNCGGMTENAKNVWLIDKPYLQSVRDPYCLNSRNARWEFKISLEKWKDYLKQNGFHISNDMSPVFFNVTQVTRKQYYRVGNDSLTFQKIRNDFKLKSAFFSIEVKGAEVNFYGRGYGHGVGLCQEGAMQMSLLGYGYREILQFYYLHVLLMDYRYLNISKNEQLKYIKFEQR
jgi:stage II sporulation protein D